MLNLLHTFSEFEKFITHFLHKNKILDKELHTFLKTNKKIGSKDRKLLSEIIFHYYRNFIKIQFLSNEINFFTNFENNIDSINIQNSIPINNLNLNLFICTLIHLNNSSDFFLKIEEKYTFWNLNSNIEKLIIYYYPNFEKDNLQSLIENLKNQINKIEKPEIKFSFPDFIIESIHKNIETFEDNNTTTLLNETLNTLNQKASVYIRVVRNFEEIENELALNDINLTQTILPNCYQLNFDGNVRLTDFITYQKGYFEIQDIGSQFTYYFTEKYIEEHLQKPKQFKILDLCAGGGGKSLLWADNIQNVIKNAKNAKTTYQIYSSDITIERLKGLNERLDKNVKIKRNITPQIINYQNIKFHNQFDLLIIDAPCSGIGTCRRDVNLKLKITPEDLQKFQSIQISLIENNYILLKTGGLLIYITCSLSYEENFAVVNDITQKLKGKIKPINISEYLDEIIKNEILNVYNKYNLHDINITNSTKNQTNNNSNHFTILPQYFNSDGFFVALFEKL